MSRIKTTVRRKRIVYTEFEQSLHGGAKCRYWRAHTLRGCPLHHGSFETLAEAVQEIEPGASGAWDETVHHQEQDCA